MKNIYILILIIFSGTSLANEPTYYDWETLTYTTELTEISSQAVLTVNMENSKKNKGVTLSDMKLTVNRKLLQFPESVAAEFYSINPVSISISTETMSINEESNIFITLHFRYAGEKSLYGAVSFLNYKYYIRTVSEL
ncbi:hypothetical protein [Cellvibrio sp. NN19]|uniref:hypothetical protein n=1 Tax=Cellvibrio chitinivorans TaxID=3102792 RepID=UPI002B411C12|nr:hypothetical protein [Cellvibrio sp. NN19]